MTVRIGLTGPIGCGKSTVAGWIGERPGVVVIDADVVAREVVQPGEPAFGAVVVRFGPEVVRADGSLDRAALGRIVFADPVALADLEAITHPPVRARILARLAEAERDGSDAVVIEAIKLVEGGLADLCDDVWLVTCDPMVQLERVVERVSDPADAARRIEAQGDLVERLRPAATHVIDTSGSVNEARSSVDTALTETLRGARAGGRWSHR